MTTRHISECLPAHLKWRFEIMAFCKNRMGRESADTVRRVITGAQIPHSLGEAETSQTNLNEKAGPTVGIAPPYPQRWDAVAECHAVANRNEIGEAMPVNNPPRANGKGELPADMPASAAEARAGLTLNASTHAIAPAVDRALENAGRVSIVIFIRGCPMYLLGREPDRMDRRNQSSAVLSRNRD